MDGVFSCTIVDGGSNCVEDTGVGIFHSDSIRWILGIFGFMVHLGDWNVSSTIAVLIGAVLARNAKLVNLDAHLSPHAVFA